MARRRYELTDFEWSIIEPLLPTKPRGVPRVDDRKVLNGIFWRLRAGTPWAETPERYGPPTTCYNRFVRWRKLGVWDSIFEAITAAYDGDLQMIDSSSIRVHQHGANAKKGAYKPPRAVPLTPDAWGGCTRREARTCPRRHPRGRDGRSVARRSSLQTLPRSVCYTLEPHLPNRSGSARQEMLWTVKKCSASRNSLSSRPFAPRRGRQSRNASSARFQSLPCIFVNIADPPHQVGNP